MKHRIFGKKLGRNHNERQALIKTLSHDLFLHGTIETTDAKAKAIIPLVEHLCNVAIKKDALSASRELGRYFQSRAFVKTVLSSLKTTFGEQSQNFTRMVKSHRRQGDDALIVKLTFTKPLVVEKPAAKEEVKEVKAPAKKAVKAPAKKAPAKKAPVKKAQAAKKE